MKEVLENLHQVCSTLNDKFNGKLLDQEKLNDFLEDIRDDWNSSFEQKVVFRSWKVRLNQLNLQEIEPIQKGFLKFFGD
ncbi:hypothetical protein [Streptococcus sp. 27098_8_113]|uniref:hypothetical protein n=1 Tax=Streptococcus sp. 27098_8_113 TaxID=3003669 RepID=UPI00352E2AB1